MTNTNIQLPWSDWKIVKTLGHGSFGAVYEIERDNLGYVERAALKVLSLPQSKQDIDEMINDGYDSESITIRLEGYLKDIVREYSLMAKMKGHANIVYCDDLKYVQRDNGIGWDIFIRMELLQPLAKSLTDPISPSTVRLLGIDICNALIHCKKQNILHRDIKPQNIFVSSNGTYKLGDFGVAKISEHTTSGTKAGTYRYMAPEVYKSEPYGAAADIYSLGLVMYWMLNERRGPFLPLPPQVPTITMEEEAKWRRFTGEALPEPAHGSVELKRIVMKACAYDPKDRYASASEMLDDLLYAEDHTTCLFPDDNYNQKITPSFDESFEKSDKTITPSEEGTVAPSEDCTVVLNHAKRQPTIPVNVQETPVNIPEPKTPKKKSILPLILIAVLLLAGISIVGIKMLSSDKQKNQGTDNTQIATETESIENDIIYQRDIIASGARQTTVIQSDGTAISDGNNEFGQCDVSDWTNLVSVSSGDFFTLGLHEDGAVSAVGDNEFGQCDVSDWTDVVAVSAGDFHSVGVRKDGTLLATGKNEDGQCDVDSLVLASEDPRKIIAISASFNHTVVLYSDGTVAAVGNNKYGQCDVTDWTDISAVYAGVQFTVGLKKDGTVIAVGKNDYGQCNVENWTNVAMISAGDFHTIAVTHDDIILSTGRNDYGQCNVKEWNNISAIGAGCKHTVAVTHDGDILAAGSNEFEQCNIMNSIVK